MKKTILLIFLLLSGLQNYAFSQRYSLLHSRLNWDVGILFSRWTQTPASIQWSSNPNLGFHIGAQYRIKLNDSNTLGIQFGPALSAVNLHTNVRVWNVQPDGNIDPGSFMAGNYQKNKLALTYLELPLELAWKARNSKIKVAIGFLGGVAVDAHTKTKRGDVKEKIKSFQDIAPLEYGPSLRLGWNLLSLYAHYNLSSSFTDNSADYYRLFSAGILVSFF